jgi:hypothetical protein
VGPLDERTAKLIFEPDDSETSGGAAHLSILDRVPFPADDVPLSSVIEFRQQHKKLMLEYRAELERLLQGAKADHADFESAAGELVKRAKDKSLPLRKQVVSRVAAIKITATAGFGAATTGLEIASDATSLPIGHEIGTGAVIVLAAIAAATGNYIIKSRREYKAIAYLIKAFKGSLIRDLEY